MSMEQTPENLLIATKSLMRLRGMRGFPEDKDVLDERVKALARLVWNAPISEILDKTAIQLSDNPRVKGSPHPKIGDGNDIDWLIETTIDLFEFFPSHAELRGVYTRYLPPSPEMRRA